MSSAQPQAGPSGAMPGPSGGGADAGRNRGQASTVDKETKFTMKTQKTTGPSAKRYVAVYRKHVHSIVHLMRYKPS